MVLPVLEPVPLTWRSNCSRCNACMVVTVVVAMLNIVVVALVEVVYDSNNEGCSTILWSRI